MLALMWEGSSVAELARRHQPGRTTLRRWKSEELVRKNASGDETSEQRIRRLERENALLREDKAILERVAAWLSVDGNGCGRNG